MGVLPLALANHRLDVGSRKAALLFDGIWAVGRCCHILHRKKLAEHALVALAIPVGQMPIVNSMLITIFALNMHRHMVRMHVERLDPHLQHHNHQENDG